MTTAHSRSLMHVLLFFYPQILQLAGQTRLERAVRLARSSVAYGDHPGLFDVVSQSMQNASYEVDTAKQSCSCKDSQSGNLCPHRIAVAIKTIASDLLYDLQRENIGNLPFVQSVLEGNEI
jgi:hypothetical protein